MVGSVPREPEVRISILASGSGGNAVVVEGGGSRLLIDCGLSVRQLDARMKAADIDIETVDAVCVSHEHVDHVRGLPVLLRRHRTPLFATEGTLMSVRERLAATGRLEAERELRVGGLTVLPVATSHDAAEPVGFVVSNGAARVALVTDTGDVTPALLERLSGCHALLLEANHDPDMLRIGPYPWPLKRRIASSTGHLSNLQTRHAVERLVHSRLEVVVGMHLSRENNAPDLALVELSRVLSGSDVHLAVADQERPLVIEVGEQHQLGGQLGLF